MQASNKNEDASTQLKEELAHAQGQLDKAKTIAKEEEEKRVKAISLLKTVRQKLVKTEKDKDEVTQELHSMRERDKSEKDKWANERSKLLKDVEAAQTDRDRTLSALRAQFDREFSLVRERNEKEKNAFRAQFEAELSVFRVGFSFILSCHFMFMLCNRSQVMRRWTRKTWRYLV